jgi:hypothetical protein
VRGDVVALLFYVPLPQPFSINHQRIASSLKPKNPPRSQSLRGAGFSSSHGRISAQGRHLQSKYIMIQCVYTFRRLLAIFLISKSRAPPICYQTPSKQGRGVEPTRTQSNRRHGRHSTHPHAPPAPRTPDRRRRSGCGRGSCLRGSCASGSLWRRRRRRR